PPSPTAPATTRCRAPTTRRSRSAPGCSKTSGAATCASPPPARPRSRGWLYGKPATHRRTSTAPPGPPSTAAPTWRERIGGHDHAEPAAAAGHPVTKGEPEPGKRQARRARLGGPPAHPTRPGHRPGRGLVAAGRRLRRLRRRREPGHRGEPG